MKEKNKNEHQYAEIHLQGETVKRMKTFTYLDVGEDE